MLVYINDAISLFCMNLNYTVKLGLYNTSICKALNVFCSCVLGFTISTCMDYILKVVEGNSVKPVLSDLPRKSKILVR